MPNELILRSSRTIRSGEPRFRQVLVTRSFERIRVLAACPAGAYSDVWVYISHIEGEDDLGLLDKFTLVPGTSVSRAYEAPGIMVGVSAVPIGESETGLDVWVWGYRPEPDSAGPPFGAPADRRILAGQ